ncbi:MAG TPA: gamma-glutamylcyclotransferase family protein [Solirubrobacteraceae bacterium]|jgi:gamma-glutamylcyclotransferase|nr:gamma-glutamylcyclotransferase family protein [Solirubrobacteraceae bacterium]
MSFTRYFAYGSNMAESVMAAHCPGHRYIGLADLPEHRLAFTRRSVRTLTGVADIVRADGQSVWGALYELDESDLRAIDRKEGNGSNYERMQVRVRPAGRGPYADALTYAVIDPLDTEVQPSHRSTSTASSKPRTPACSPSNTAWRSPRWRRRRATGCSSSRARHRVRDSRM